MDFKTQIHAELEDAFKRYLAEQEKIEKGQHAAVIRARKALADLGNIAKARRAELIEDYNLNQA